MKELESALRGIRKVLECPSEEGIDKALFLIEFHLNSYFSKEQTYHSRYVHNIIVSRLRHVLTVIELGIQKGNRVCSDP